jgi:MFS family permease
MNYEQNEPKIDKIINNYGYRWLIWKNFLICFIVLACEGFHNTFFSDVIIPLKNYYHITNTEVQMISSIYFLFLGFGSLTTGYLTEKFKRTYILNISLGLIAVGHILTGLTSSLIVFFIARQIVAFFVGVAVPVSLNLLTEYLPIRHRSTVLSSVWVSYGIGQIYILLLMLWLMPQYETVYYQKTVLISSSLSILCFFLGLLLIQDSPRSLILNHHHYEAFEILEYMNDGQLNEEEKELIIAQVTSGSNKDIDVSIKEIFSKDMYKTTTLLMFIWIIFSIVFYGPSLISSLTMAHLGVEAEAGTNRDILIQQIIIVMLSSPNTMISGLISEIPWLGRNKTTILCMVIAVIFNILTIFNPKHYYLHFSLFFGFSAMSMNVNSTYSCEVYPTKVRDLAIGFLFFATRLGGFISQILYIYLHHWGIWVPYHVTNVLCLVTVVLVFFLPIETFGRPLDQEIKFTKLEEEIEEDAKKE